MSEVFCGAEPCPVILNSTCVFYRGQDLLYIGINTNDNLQIVIEKINQTLQNSGVGYAFNNGVVQTSPFDPVQLGGSLIQNTTIGGSYTLTFVGNVEADKHITTIGAGSNTATLGNTSIVDTVLRGRINIQQYATGSRPAYVKGALIYDSTLSKLVVGGASGWEVVTSS